MIKAYVLFAARPVKVVGLDVELDGVAVEPSKVKVQEVAPGAAVQATVIWLIVADVCEIPVTALEAVKISIEELAVVPQGLTVVIIKGYLVFADKPVNVAVVPIPVEGVAADPPMLNEYDVAPRAPVQATVIWLILADVCETPVTAAEAVDILNGVPGVVPQIFTLVISKGYVVFANNPVKVAVVPVPVEGVVAVPFMLNEYEVAPGAAVHVSVTWLIVAAVCVIALTTSGAVVILTEELALVP